MNNGIDKHDGLSENEKISGNTEENININKEGEETVDDEASKSQKNDGDSITKKENDDWRTRRPSREILEECLKKSFTATSKDDLISIIENGYSELAGKIECDDRIGYIIRIFINYCTENDEFGGLWSGIKKERPKRYDEFFYDWEMSYNNEQKIRSNKSSKDEQKNQPEDKDITKWFFDELDDIKQSMVITTALFHGVEKNIFNEMRLGIHDLLFPAVQEPPKNELSSDESKEDSEQQKEKQSSPPPVRLKNELEQFHTAKLKFVSDKRNSDYGLVDVEIVIFEFNGYQTEVLKLIKDSLLSKKDDLFSFIKELGYNENAEKRLFAVNAVIALSETHLFQNLLDYIIREWAKKGNYYGHQATASALSGILLLGRQENEVLALLNSWLKNSTSIFLNITSMFTYYLIADKYPEQALHAIEHVSSKENIILSLKSLDIAFRVYRSNRSVFIAHLYNWIKDDKPLLRQQAGIYFFRFIDLDDAVEDQDTRAKIVEIISTLWKGRNMPLRLKMQQETAEKVRAWAEEALSALENDEKEAFSNYQILFYELYRKCSEKLDHYFSRWQEYREYKQKRAVERGASSESLYVARARQIRFSILIPKEG
jgi:hypothetical protein